MMETKVIEIRDRATFIPALAVKLDPANEAERYLLARAGFGEDRAAQSAYVILVRVAGGNGQATCDVYDWGSATMQVAHQHLLDHWADVSPGAVVDAEYLRGESAAPKRSERETSPF